MAQTNIKRYLTEDDARQYTSLSKDTLRKLRIQGLPYIQFVPFGSIYYDKADIDNFLSTFKSITN